MQQAIEYAESLETISYQMAELARIKESIEAKLCVLLHHNNEGSKSYIVDRYKVTVSTGYIYSLDKEEYQIIHSSIPKCFNPVRTKTSYEIDKNIIKEAEKYGSKQDLDILAKIITKKPKKLHISVKAAV